MAKQLAVSTQLKNALKNIQQLEEKIAVLEKQKIQDQSTKDSLHKQLTEANNTIEQVHQVLDAVPGSIQRESEGENSWDRVKRSPVTRLAAWLAIR